MNNQIASSSKSHSIRDVAVDGLLHGLVAGAVMLLYLMAAALTINESPLTLLSRFGRDEGTSPLLGFVSHLGMSAIYGIFFVLLWRVIGRKLPRNSIPILGIAYGIILFLVAELILLPAVQSPMLQIPAIHFGIGHVIYGFVLGYLTGRK